VIGGLVTSTLLTLFVLPVLYILFEYFSKRRRHRRRHHKRKTTPPAAALWILLVLSIGALSAQTPVTLQQALDSARANNLDLQAARIGTDYSLKMTGTAFELAPTAIDLEVGQINTAASDTRLGIGQSFQLPAVYRSRRSVLEYEHRISRTEEARRQREVEWQVKNLFYDLLAGAERQRLLTESDSLYALFVEKAALRLRSGETNPLEKNAAETQRVLLRQQLARVGTERILAARRLQTLLNAEMPVQPAAVDFRYQVPDSMVAGISAGLHPVLEVQQQRIDLASAQQAVERSKLLPAFTLGLSNQSIIGWQQEKSGADVYFDAGKRFFTFSVGVQVPVFAKAQKTRVAAAGLLLKQEDARLQAIERFLRQDYLAALERYRQLNEQVQEYQTVLLPNAEVLLTTAQRQLLAGEINFVEWLVLVRQAFDVRMGYLDAVQACNQAAFELEYYR
jgi:cobalt-zinc-cadmium resistance protein CzcA